MSHIAVERNRRRQMNEHLKVLRSLTPCFYIKRGDQASIIDGVIEFIKELQQVLQSLEANKRRKSLSPSPSPRQLQLINTPPPPPDSPFSFESTTTNKELGVCCNSSAADVEAKISGPNVLLKVIARKMPGQILKIISVLEKLSFQIIHLNISSMEDTVLYSFVVKIGLECRLSLEELALEVQRSFSLDPLWNAEVNYI
ncbi:transcription factor MUTE isoform X2 [Syzygium oleosum]|uniref:transcription factor MUTE isoform X2 n=1 Tax=Syzygium oleosum TaxID=219896 RepID=UPI0024B93E10|nr:transcription factor MUTE isoform X2 [Syzygium oleosum]